MDATLITVHSEKEQAAATFKHAWTPAVTSHGELREHCDVAEVTGLLDLSGWPEGRRVIVRREHPHPGVQLSAWHGPRAQNFLHTHSTETDQDRPQYAGCASSTTGRRPEYARRRTRTHEAHARTAAVSP